MTGMHAVAISPKAGAHGELCGMMAIKAALEARGDKRTIVLVPESAHGTNPATAALLGYTVVDVPARADGTVDPEAVKARLVARRRGDHADQPQHLRPVRARRRRDRRGGPRGRRLLLLRRRQLQRHRRQGAARAISASTPCTSTCTRPSRRRTAAAVRAPGRWSSRRSSRPSRRCPSCASTTDGAEFVETRRDAGDGAQPFGRMTAFHGQMGMFVRALTYMLSHGADGMRQASEDAVLNANYIRAGLARPDEPAVRRPACMHEALFDDRFLEGTGVTTLDFAKAMIDEGFHPMTMYFPLVVHGAMLIEPTESESKASLDLFVATLRDLVMRRQARRGRALPPGADARPAPPPRRDPRRPLAEAQLGEAGAVRRGGGVKIATRGDRHRSRARHVAEVFRAYPGGRSDERCFGIRSADLRSCRRPRPRRRRSRGDVEMGSAQLPRRLQSGSGTTVRIDQAKVSQMTRSRSTSVA